MNIIYALVVMLTGLKEETSLLCLNPPHAVVLQTPLFRTPPEYYLFNKTFSAAFVPYYFVYISVLVSMI